MASTKDQVFALIKKEWILLKRSKNWILQEILSPLTSIYLVYQSTLPEDQGFGTSAMMGPLAAPLFLSRATFGLTFNVVFEKSQNFKEYLRVNGASLFSYIFATFIFYLARAILAATIFYVGVILVGAGSANTGDRILGYLNLVIYSIALINFSLALTTFFSSARLATQVSSLITLLLTFVYYAVATSDQKIYYYLGCLLPPVAAMFGFSIAGFNQVNVAGFTPGEGIAVQVANCFLYFALYVYLDRVVPSDSGIKDPICKRRKRKDPKKKVIREQELGALDLENNAINANPLLESSAQSTIDIQRMGTEDASSAEYHEPFHNPSGLKRTVFIDNLSKMFGKTVAVDRVTMPMFEKQIFCLLGHNGAGKTTTINLMTGLLRPDGGNVFYDGEDFNENFETVRRKFGLCVQKDILYENMTAAEHIELISRLRGVPKEQIPEYINALSAKVGIPNELSKQASTLSGGNKRKLSLALAIAGETKVVFLDEPTSGLDPNARRNFWDIVRSLRDEGKTILLTTHNLDEADELADRIAILSKGKLLILGTSNYLKKKYGIGYNLIITAKPDAVDNFHENIDRLSAKVKSFINGTEVDSKTSHEMLKMSLPYGESSKFAELFKNLENEPSIEIALELNTLEDVFVNIGLQEEAAEAANSSAPQSHENIPIPSSINEGSTYKFSSQVKAIFRRRFYCTFRNRTNVLQIVLPLLYVILTSIITSGYTIPEAQVYFFSITSMMGFLINTISYTAFPVWERETKVKYLMRTIGLRPLPYWIGTFLFDIIVISSYGILLLPIGQIFNVSLIAAQSLNFLLVMLSFGFALLNLSYLLSWIYSKQATVFKFHLVLVIFGFFYLPFFLFIFMVLIPTDNVVGTKTVFVIGAIVSPPMVFLYSCFSLTPLFLLTNNDGSLLTRLFRHPLFYVGVMFCQGLIYFGLNYLIEKLSLRLKTKVPRVINSTTFIDQVPNPQEISQEVQRAKSEHNTDPTKAIDLEKVYENGFPALRGVTFGVEKRQIFGLLGPNGAGKSTTFNILTGLIAKSGGQIIFNGQELHNLDPKMFDGAGICPQFDALWDHLTVREHLDILGQIKGIEKWKVEEALVYYTKILRMEEHVNKKAAQLSGGTKRKLCVANLLIGAPVVQFMDEPSTGLDPMSKRSLYDTIMRNLEDRNASIILTTHSMSEAESLCNKIGILINGRFMCIGNLPYLKSRYGSGYKISVVKANSNARVYEKVIREAFSTAVKEEDNSEIYDNYRILQQDFSFEKAFLVLEKLKEDRHISDFNIINTTLEQVFIQFSRNQIQPPEGQPSS